MGKWFKRIDGPGHIMAKFRNVFPDGLLFTLACFTDAFSAANSKITGYFPLIGVGLND